MTGYSISTHLVTHTPDSKDVLEGTFVGQLKAMSSHLLLTYEEPENGRTFCHIEKAYLKIRRTGSTQSLMEFVPKTCTRHAYRTPEVTFDLEIETSALEVDLREECGSVKVVYVVRMNGCEVAKNELTITWLPLQGDVNGI